MTKERLQELKKIKDDAKAKIKGKPFKTLSTKEMNELLETISKLLGLI